jgi:hypothetical protein
VPRDKRYFVLAEKSYPSRREGTSMAMFNKDDPEAAKKMRAIFSPGQVD